MSPMFNFLHFSTLILSVHSLGPVKYFDSAEMTTDLFDSILLHGYVAVIKGASSFWPIANWTCKDYRTNPQLEGFALERVYGETDGSFVPLCPHCEDWASDKRKSLNDDKSGPLLAPLYWAVRENSTSVHVIDKLTPSWPFLSKANYFWKRGAVELWFSPKNAGAKYHIDGHVQMTVVSQMVGSRRWRLSAIPDEPPTLLPVHLDSHVFSWEPEHTLTLHTGDMLIFPPGAVHDTMNVGESCAASVTHQIGVPLPVRAFRRHLRQFQSVGDTRETWPVIVDLASFGYLRAAMTAETPYFEAFPNATNLFLPGTEYDEANPEAFFRHIYRELWMKHKLPGHYSLRRMAEYVAFHDVDGNGEVSEEEFMGTTKEWLEVELENFNAFPPKYRLARYFYEKLEALVDENFWIEIHYYQEVLRNKTLQVGEESVVREEL